MADIFISYARADRDRIEKLASVLEGEGYSVWWDRHIKSGAEFSKDIEAELNAAKAVVVAWSADANQSRWVKDEANFAAEAGKLMAVTLDETPPPMGFRQYHALDFSGWNGAVPAPIFQDLLTTLRDSVGQGAGSADPKPQEMSATSAAVTPINASRFSDPKIWSGALAVLLIVVSAGVSLTRSGRNAPEPAIEIAETGTSIAVLPFADMSPAGDQEYFSDGMAEEILNALVKLPNLRVAGRTSSFSFKGKDVAIPEIGKALNVTHVLEGSVRKQGNNVRITAQLIKSEDGIHLWSETYDGTLENIFDLQDNVSRAIAAELEIKLNVGESVRLAKQLTTNQEAYDLYLRGRRLSNITWGEDTLLKSIDLYERAVALDPDFFEAWVYLALDNWRLPLNIPVKDQAPYLEKSEEALQRALEINPTDTHALYNQAQLALINKNYAEGARLMENLPASDTNFGFHYLILGRTREALNYFERGLEADSLNSQLYYWKAVAEFQLGQFENSERSAIQAKELGFAGAAFAISEARFMQGDDTGARTVLLEAYDETAYFFPQFADRDQLEYAINVIYGNDEVAKEQLITALEQSIDPDYPVPSSTVGAWRLLGEPERFIDAIDHHIPAHTPINLIFVWGTGEGDRKIRQHPKFAAWTDKVGLVTAWQEFGWPDKCKPNAGTDGSNGQFTCT